MFSGIQIFYFAFVALCGALQTHFHGRGRNGKRHLQRRFLRKRGAAGNTPSVFAAQSQLPQGDALWQCRKLCRPRQKPSPWGRWHRVSDDGRGKFSSQNKNRGVQVVKLHVPFLFSLHAMRYQSHRMPRRRPQSKPCCSFLLKKRMEWRNWRLRSNESPSEAFK